MGVLAYNLLHMIRQFYVWGKEVKRSMDWLIKRLVKVGARVSYQARRWYVHVASAFPWRTTNGQCWPGDLSPTPLRNRPQGRCAKILKKFTISGCLSDKFMKICYIIHLTRQIGDERGQQNRFFSWGGPGCRIISDNRRCTMKPVILCLLILFLAAPVSAQMTITPQSSNPLDNILQQFKSGNNPHQEPQELYGFHVSFANPRYNRTFNHYDDTPNSSTQQFNGNNFPDWSQGFFGSSRSPIGRR